MNECLFFKTSLVLIKVVWSVKFRFVLVLAAKQSIHTPKILKEIKI